MVEAMLVIAKVSEAMLATNSGFTKLIMEVVQMYLQCIVQCTTEIDLTNYPSHNEVPSYDGNSSCDELPSYFTYLCKMN